jgi:uncharacterized protein (TIGR02444 family)
MSGKNRRVGQADSYWRFALEIYARPGVSQACLDMQDSLGLDVNVLLMALLAARIHERAITSAEIEQADHTIAAWREQVVAPLRAVRRQMKTSPALANWPYAVGDAAHHADTGAAHHAGTLAGRANSLRAKLKALELDAEHVEQHALAAWIKALPAGDGESHEDICVQTAGRVAQFYAGRQPPGGNAGPWLRNAATVAAAASLRAVD